MYICNIRLGYEWLIFYKETHLLIEVYFHITQHLLKHSSIFDQFSLRVLL